MRESSEHAILSYFDDLLCEPAVPVIATSAQRQEQELVTKKQVAAPSSVDALTEMDVAIKELEHAKKQQLQALLNSQLLSPAVEAPAAITQVVLAPSQPTQTVAAPVAINAAHEANEVQPAVYDEMAAVGHIRREFLAWAANGRPMWAQNTFDVLLFKVAGLTLAVPLIALGHIHRRSEQLTSVFAQADWFMGLQPSARGNIRVVNTALLVMPERYKPEFAAAAKYIVTIDGLDWGLAVDSVETIAAVVPDEVTWRSERSKRPWLAGTVKTQLCALIDIPQLGQLLQSADKKRRPQA